MDNSPAPLEAQYRLIGDVRKVTAYELMARVDAMMEVMHRARTVIAEHRHGHLDEPTAIYLTPDEARACILGLDAWGGTTKALKLREPELFRLLGLEVRCDPQGMRVA